MTQKNIETMDRIVEELLKGKKLSEVLAHTYTKRHVMIPFNTAMFNVSIKDLHMSTQPYNALMRSKVFTINNALDYNDRHGLKTIRNFGVSSFVELMEAILDYSWENMHPQEREVFLIDVVERNCENLKA